MKLNFAFHRNRRASHGSALIEATLTLPLFLLIWFSLFDFGWVFFFHQTLAYQARSAARYAAVNPDNLTAVRNMVLYNQTAAGSAPVLGLQPANVTVFRNGQGSTDDCVSIVISGYHYGLITPGWAGSYAGRPITVTVPVEQ